MKDLDCAVGAGICAVVERFVTAPADIENDADVGRTWEALIEARSTARKKQRGMNDKEPRCYQKKFPHRGRYSPTERPAARRQSPFNTHPVCLDFNGWPSVSERDFW
jgi:hypothetical protein